MYDKIKQGISRQNKVVLAAALLFFSGFGLLGVGAASQIQAPMPMAISAHNYTAVSSSQDHSDLILPASIPTYLSIPSIDVESDLIQVGKNLDGSIEVPQGDDYHKAAWYKHSVTPGQQGSSIIEGHIDSFDDGPSVFFNLGKLKPKDTVKVNREDGKVAVFEVDKIAVYKKAEFPTNEVYGGRDKPTLVLITCGGSFNSQTGEYDSNIVVYSSLKAVINS